MLISSIRGDLQQADELRANGARLVVDDFGVGYSSLSYLLSLPIDTLKIDKSFIDNVTSDPVRHQVVSAISKMAEALDIPCVAEGVESMEVIGDLGEMGIARIQGFAIERPMPLDQIEQTLRALVISADHDAASDQSPLQAPARSDLVAAAPPMALPTPFRS